MSKIKIEILDENLKPIKCLVCKRNDPAGVFNVLCKRCMGIENRKWKILRTIRKSRRGGGYASG